MMRLDTGNESNFHSESDLVSASSEISDVTSEQIQRKIVIADLVYPAN